MGVGRLSANAKKVSANAKSSLMAILALHISFFLSTFVVNNQITITNNNMYFNLNDYEKDDVLGARRHPDLRRKCVHIVR